MSTSSPQSAEAGPSSPPQPSAEGKKPPVVILCIGMAGSVRMCPMTLLLADDLHRMQGKTTLMQRLNSHLHSKDTRPYILNLDPAVTHMPYSANIDIRDTVDYKGVMKQWVA